ncbi:MAG: macrolide ABC transporter ATP-binding protein [Desulfuromonas sp.]|nr:MAG: macrolide ABC transporter ATP-binding protein [Desulfuromonas sp.]
MKNSPLIDLQNVSKVYHTGHQQVHAVAEFTTTFDPGEFTVLAGPSGSGKTTLLNLIGCLDKASEGRILIEGGDIAQRSSRELAVFRLHRIGFIFQSYNLIPVLSAAENAEFTLMLQGVSPAQRRAKVLEILNQLGLEGLADRRPGDLSGGQQQRVAIARAIAADPAVVLADEPTANLDSETANDLLDLMERLNQEHQVTFIFSSHDQRVIDKARRVVTLRDGHLVSDSASN